MDENSAIQVDLEKVLADKLGSKSWMVPSFAVSWLKKTIRQDEINDKLRRYFPKRGAEFCDAALSDMNISLSVVHAERMPAFENRRVIFVCNHPLGGMDGIALISLLTKMYGKGVRFVVNDILMAIEPLRDSFLPINKHGKQSKDAVAAFNVAMEGPDPIFIFPAGLVSRRQKDGSICDLEWNKMFVSKALQYKRDVVPIYFHGTNSQGFYDKAYWRKRLGIPFNLEMLYLPAEALGAQNKEFTAVIGKRIPYDTLSKGKPKDVAQAVKALVYRLSADIENK